jgi:hypothetical protein
MSADANAMIFGHLGRSAFSISILDIYASISRTMLSPGCVWVMTLEILGKFGIWSTAKNSTATPSWGQYNKSLNRV